MKRLPHRCRRWLFLLVALTGALDARAAEAVVVDANQVRALGIRTVAPQQQPRSEMEGIPALVAIPNRQQRVVASPLAGMLTTMAVAPGDSVKRGQLLARLQSPDLALLQRDYLHAATEAELARDTMERDGQLLREGIIAESRYRAARSRHLQASAALSERGQALLLAGVSKVRLAALRSGKAQDSTVDLVAPLSGVVIEQSAVPGQRVDAATALYKVAQLSPLWLEIEAPLARMASVTEGAEVRVPAAGARGRLVTVSRSANPVNQTVLLRALVTEGAERLRPGQFVEASIALSGDGPQWSVPTAALARLDGNPHVFLQTEKGFVALGVTLVSEGARESVVRAALQPGARIAVEGVAALKARLLGVGD